ncbi:hypothetical protein [Herbaspirillum sp. C7C8]|uniref:hypothetical protein n=1 Tax=Herbaspirillum sp. C7C8 TaxID=2736665 RepID=UPI001F5236EC|nr:hypothetical protein [Herbaspirillum sp. C7C8]MCI1006998.1 hypothetical protein [Herbaspirillum sp. C7C8]
MTTQAAKIDPIRDRFFTPLEIAELWSARLFFATIVFSLCVAYFDEPSQKSLISTLQWIQVVAVLALFTLDIFIRLHLAPRAHDARAQDFLAKAYGAPLISQQTSGYYNHAQTDPILGLAAQLFENSLFTKEIVGKMLRRETVLIAIYMVIWAAVFSNRDVQLSWIALCAQVLFGEQILARWLRMWWLRQRCEEVYKQMRTLYVNSPAPEKFAVTALDAYTKYESSKAMASITLSSKIFDKINPAVSAEWELHRKDFGI